MERKPAMNGWLMSLFDVLFISIELMMLAVVVNSFNPRRLSGWLSAVSLIALAVIIHVISCISGGDQLIKICASLALMTAWSLLCFRASLAKCVFISAFCIAYYTLADITLIIIYTKLIGIDVAGFLSDMYNYASFNILVKLTELLGVITLYIWIRRHGSTAYSGASSWIRTLAYPAASAIVGICLLKVVTDFQGASFDVFICMMLVLFTDLMSIFLANYLERQQIDIRNSIILKASVRSELESVHTWQEAYAQQRKMTHEFNNQLAVIKGMLEQGGGSEGVLDYINQIQSFPDPSKPLVNTRCPAADVLINQKLCAAGAKDIDLRVQLDDLSSVKLPDYALVVVLANIIDNALEAADRVKNAEKRRVFLKIKVTDGVTFINIENYTDSPVLIRNNTVVTSKADRAKHGYGLLNVSSIIAQYGGFYTLRYDEGTGKFTVSIQI